MDGEGDSFLRNAEDHLPVTRRHISEYRNPLLHLCEKLQKICGGTGHGTLQRCQRA